MVINHNISSVNTLNKLNANTKAAQSALSKLSSGLKINSAADDAAGLAISQKMQAQVNGLDQAGSNAQTGISMIQTAEQSLSETQSILQRMNTLATQSANDTNTDTDRGQIQTEVVQLKAEIDRISTSTQFNTKPLLNGTLGVQLDAASTLKAGATGVTAIDISGAAQSTTYTLTAGAGFLSMDDGKGNTQKVTWADNAAGTINFDKMGVKISLSGTQTDANLNTLTVKTTADAPISLQIGSLSGQTMALSIGNMGTTSLGVSGVDLSTQAGASAAITSIQNAINQVSTQRATLGADQNRLDHTINNLSTESQNLQSASSQITDVDMAAEMTNFTKNNILTQAAQAMLAQANQLPQGVLSLLK